MSIMKLNLTSLAKRIMTFESLVTVHRISESMSLARCCFSAACFDNISAAVAKLSTRRAPVVTSVAVPEETLPDRLADPSNHQGQVPPSSPVGFLTGRPAVRPLSMAT